jgi:hypothetical protein
MVDEMAEDERNVLKWLDDLAKDYPHWVGVLKTMLSRPVLPKDLTDEDLMVVKRAVHEAAGISEYGPPTAEQARLYRAGHRALVAHLTAPKTKEVEVWRVEFAGGNGLPYIDQRMGEETARELAHQRIREGASMVRVTGPHKQTVPA